MQYSALRRLSFQGVVILLLSAMLVMSILIHLNLPQAEEDSEQKDISSDGLLVGAYYYPWWSGTKWDLADEYASESQIGEYNSRDVQVIDQHIAWAKDCGIDFLAMSWWGLTPYWEDVTLRSHFLNSAQINDMEFCILYESTGRLSSTGEDAHIFEDTPENEEILLNDFDYLADAYFDHPQYFKVNDRPVVILYVTRCFANWGRWKDDKDNWHPGWEGIFAKLRANMATKGYDLYLVGDMVYWQEEEDISSNLLPFWLLDAVTGYNMHTSDEGKVKIAGSSPGIIDTEDFLRGVDNQYGMWKDTADKEGCNFVPGVMPGFNDSFYPGRNNPIIPRSPEFLADFWQIAAKHIDSDVKMLMITSFNEWFEDTQIEPAHEYGLAYLDVITTCSQNS